MTFSPSEWVGLAILTESNRPHEWYALAWAIRLRHLANREKQFGGQDYAKIITHPRQFSAFNGVTGTAEEIYEKMLQAKPRILLSRAIDTADDVLGEQLRRAPYDTRTYFFWSPQSMDPAGSLPKWNWSILRRFGMPGIDPWRFLFAAEL